ncbi:hypothetical protein C8R43DRAFT_1128209 [Mycena crocata]|nr:hypothetical protein C8R43DRAFT_1128209 [Mycena crocata]
MFAMFDDGLARASIQKFGSRSVGLRWKHGGDSNTLPPTTTTIRSFSPPTRPFSPALSCVDELQPLVHSFGRRQANTAFQSRELEVWFTGGSRTSFSLTSSRSSSLLRRLAPLPIFMPLRLIFLPRRYAPLSKFYSRFGVPSSGLVTLALRRSLLAAAAHPFKFSSAAASIFFI